MARDITSGFDTEIEADFLRPALFIKAAFDSGDVTVWTGNKSIDWSGDTYTGLGDFLGVSAVQETQKLEANGVQFTLTGIKSSLVSLALTENYQWRSITMWFVVLNASYAVIADPYKIFFGKMDVMEINDDGEMSSITVNAENNLIDLRESRERRYTPEDQKDAYSGDKGLDFVPLIIDYNLVWGS